jgi:hypothetical protein
MMKQRVGIGVAVIAVLAAGAAFVSMGGGTEQVTFLKPGLASEYLVEWPRETGAVTYPDSVEIVTSGGFTRPTQAMASGTAEVAQVSLVAIPTVLDQNPQARLVEGVKTPDDLFTLYSDDPSIQELADLEGKTVALPRESTAGTLTLLAMQDAGLDPSAYTVVNKPPQATFPLLQSGDADAALVMSMFPTDQLTRIVSPYSYWERQLNVSVAPAIIMADGREHVGVASTIAAKQNASYRVGRDNIEQITQDYMEQSGTNNSAAFRAFMDTRTVPMTDDRVAALQQLLDVAHERGMVQQEADLTAHTARADG